MERLTTTGYHLIATYMGFLILFGISIQMVTLIVLVRSSDLKTKALTPYLINVVAANSVMIVGSFPSTLASAIANQWIFNDVVCRIVGFLGGLAAVSMISTMTCITVKIHHTVTSRGVKQLNRVKNKNITHYKVILGIWIYSSVSMLPPTAGWTSMIKESADMNCAPSWRAEGTPDLVYILFLTCTAYILPVGVACVYHWKINRAINAHLKTVARFSSAQRQLDGFRNISKMAGLAITAFTITWLPYCVYVLVSAFGGANSIDAETSVIACLVAKSSILYNPFIYALVNPRFRANVMDVLKIKQSRISPNNLLRAAMESLQETISQTRQPQVRNKSPFRPRGGLENQIDCQFSLPSFVAAGKRDAAGRSGSISNAGRRDTDAVGAQVILIDEIQNKPDHE